MNITCRLQKCRSGWARRRYFINGRWIPTHRLRAALKLLGDRTAIESLPITSALPRGPLTATSLYTSIRPPSIIEIIGQVHDCKLVDLHLLLSALAEKKLITYDKGTLGKV